MHNVAKDVYHIPLMPRNSINCYIIEGVLVDAGIRTSYNRIRKSIKEVPLHAHVLTHAHPDHQGSTNEICSDLQVPLYCHEKEVYRAETGLVTSDYPSPDNLIGCFQQKYWAGEGHKVDRILKENDWVGNFRVIETPGHSAGHISFFRERDGVLIAGDVATNMHLLTTIEGLYLPPKIFTSDLSQNIQSLKKIAELNPLIICFGHGPVFKNENKKFERFVNSTHII